MGWKDGATQAGNWKTCSKCGREYDGSDDHECIVYPNDMEIERQAEAAGMAVDDYMQDVIENGRKPEAKTK